MCTKLVNKQEGRKQNIQRETICQVADWAAELFHSSSGPLGVCHLDRYFFPTLTMVFVLVSSLSVKGLSSMFRFWTEGISSSSAMSVVHSSPWK